MLAQVCIYGEAMLRRAVSRAVLRNAAKRLKLLKAQSCGPSDSDCIHFQYLEKTILLGNVRTSRSRGGRNGLKLATKLTSSAE